MARKIINIPGLPQFPPELTGNEGPLSRFLINLLRVLWAWKRGLDALIEENNTGTGGGGHIIQDEGISLANRAKLNFIGGAVVAADDSGNDATTVTITTGTQNLFEKVAVSGQSDIVADSTTDTLNIAAGSGITLTTDAATDTLTIATNAGSQGDQGPPGIDGDSGPPGPEGPRGQDGTAIVFADTVWVTMVGGGGGGGTSTAAATPAPGGGAGELVEQFQLKITPGASYSYAIGAAGISDTDGGDTTFGPLVVLGGKKGISAGLSGAGGGARGGTGAAAGSPGATGALGTAETSTCFGGSSGGGRGSGTGATGGPGGGSAGYLVGGAGGVAGGAQGGGGGGAATPWGRGGAGGAGGSVGVDAAAGVYGSGGGGGGGHASGRAGGVGGGGYLLIAWLGGSAEYTTGSGTWVAPL